MNQLPTALAVGGLGGACGVIGLVWYYATPKFFEVGYMPTQPGTGFSHQIHAGKLGLDCRYCHSHVEESPEANIPNVATCYGCHQENHVNATIVPDEKVAFIRDAYTKDQSLAWRRVHKLPDFVRNFPHNAHVKAGVSCYSCHGMIPRQPIVHQVQPLSMGWCLDCHRDPAPNLVPPDKVTDLFAVEEQMAEPGNPKTAFSPGGGALLKALQDKPLHVAPDNCGACHY